MGPPIFVLQNNPLDNCYQHWSLVGLFPEQWKTHFFADRCSATCPKVALLFQATHADFD